MDGLNKTIKRIDWIDVSKGILIFLVVYGHFAQNVAYHVDGIAFIRRFIYSFHMPAFFMISGIVFTTNFNGTVKDFIIKKIKRLIIPGYIGMIVCAIYDSIVGGKGLAYFKPILTVDNIIKQILWQNNAKLGFWFLGALFSLSIIFYLVHKYSKSNAQAVIVAVILTCLGMSIKQINPESSTWPFSIIQALVCALFFEIGIQIKTTIIHDKINWKDWFAFLVSGANVCLIKLNPFKYNVGVWNAGVGDMQWFILCGIIGSIFIIEGARIVSGIGAFKPIRDLLVLQGKESLYVYMYSGLFIDFFINHTKLFTNINAYTDAKSFVLSEVIAIIISLMAVWIARVKNNMTKNRTITSTINTQSSDFDSKPGNNKTDYRIR